VTLDGDAVKVKAIPEAVMKGIKLLEAAAKG
jgi:hypothetical protein